MSYRSQQSLIYGLLLTVGILIGVVITQQDKLQNFVPATKINYTEVKRVPAKEKPPANFPSSERFKEIAREQTKSVVYIESFVAMKSANVPQDDNHKFNEDFWNKLMPDRQLQTTGSGVIFSEDGFILTNNHVIDGAVGNRVTVELYNKQRYEASIVGADPSTDIAVIKIDGTDFPHITLGNSDHIEVGDWVLAIGNPFRLRSTVTAGIVSALGRDVDIIDDRMRVESFIQTDAAINKGNSGGALVDLSGALVGINTAIASASGSYEGYGFAVPINIAMRVASDLMEYGKVRRALLGVQIVTVNQRRSKQLELPAVAGVEIVNVVGKSSADQSGLKINDVVLAINGRTVNASNELQAELFNFRPGETIEMFIWRDGEAMTVNVNLLDAEDEVLAEWMGESESRNDYPTAVMPEDDEILFHSSLGFSLLQVLDSNSGTLKVLVSKVVQGDEAWNRGMRTDDEILSINNTQITSLDDAQRILSENSSKKFYKFEVKKANGAQAFYQLQTK